MALTTRTQAQAADRPPQYGGRRQTALKRLPPPAAIGDVPRLQFDFAPTFPLLRGSIRRQPKERQPACLV
ncbi:hypothetical protein SKAU_G00181090 [Synaphobranchus kaupii]|uniref:Uncharacterized protein n=1 Tax=Synaphobranchus kaupii TaxID=118154 RepID=A0A9Q1FMY6_SYNKA|nr:hypothetical protein SKAU_G00181090 [Synaphobranchus kaupii]